MFCFSIILFRLSLISAYDFLGFLSLALLEALLLTFAEDLTLESLGGYLVGLFKEF